MQLRELSFSDKCSNLVIRGIDGSATGSKNSVVPFSRCGIAPGLSSIKVHYHIGRIIISTGNFELVVA